MHADLFCVICGKICAHLREIAVASLNEDPKYNYEYMLPSLASRGGNFFRTWICSWNLPIDWKSGFNSNRYTSSDKYYNSSVLFVISGTTS